MSILGTEDVRAGSIASSTSSGIASDDGLQRIRLSVQQGLESPPGEDCDMTLNLNAPQPMHTDFTPRITVIGVGGGGTNAVENMIAANLRGVEFVVANTDAQQLMHSKADRRVQLG